MSHAVPIVVVGRLRAAAPASVRRVRTAPARHTAAAPGVPATEVFEESDDDTDSSARAGADRTQGERV